MGGEGKREGKGVRGREGMFTLMRIWKRAADWLRPALLVSEEKLQHLTLLDMRRRCC